MNQVVTLDAQRAETPAPRLPTMLAGAAVRPIVPQDFEGAWRIASAVCKAQMAPRGLDTPEKAMVAIMHGLEVGLTPMNALQSIAVVNGRPTIWGDGAIGLVRGSGLLEWMEEKYEGKEDDALFKAVCLVKRRNEPNPIRGEFSTSDARKAGLWGKQGPWTQYPKRMLQMRARAFALRDGFADVLKGLSIKEEVEDYHLRDVTQHGDEPPPPPPPPQIEAQPAHPMQQSSAKLDEIESLVFVEADRQPETKGAVTAQDDGPPAPADDGLDIPKNLRRAAPTKKVPDAGKEPKAFIQWAKQTLDAVTDAETLPDIWNDVIEPRMDGLFPPDKEEVQGLYRNRERALEP